MSKLPHIRAVEGEAAAKAPAADSPESATIELTAEQEYIEDEIWYEEPDQRRFPGWLAPSLALLVIAVWTGFFGWANRAEVLAGATPQQWVGWVTSWTIPVLLVVAVWLLVMRSSTREANRFGDAASLLSAESARLEDRLATVNRELSLAREFLSAQTRELEFLGRVATERLSEHAVRLQSLILDNGTQVDAIANVSVNALDNMGKLRDSLPVIANSARDVSNQIGGAGRAAQGQLNELISGFERLNDFGSASERQVTSLRDRIDEALSAFSQQAEQLEALADKRFVLLRESSETFRGDLDSREVEALAAIRSRAEVLRTELAESHAANRAEENSAYGAMRDRLALLREEAAAFAMGVRDGETAALDAWGEQLTAMQDRLREAIEQIQTIDESALNSAQRKLISLKDEAEAVDARLGERDQLFHDEIARRRTNFDEAEQAALDQLKDRLARFDTDIADRREAQLARLAQLETESESIGNAIAALGDRFTTAASQGDMARESLSQGIDALNVKLTESREALDGTDMAIAALTDASVRLLELIQASSKQCRDDLPTAMMTSEARLNGLEGRANEVFMLLDRARESGDAITSNMDAAENRSREAMAGIENFQTRIGEATASQVESLERLHAGITALNEESSGIAMRLNGELGEAIGTLQERAHDALAGVEKEQAEHVNRIADNIGAKSAEAIGRAVAEYSEQAIGQVDEATARSTEASREAVRHLRDQLAKVNDLTSNLETRILRARERAEEQVDNDFSRRVALITESLNSNSIDIAKALSTEVTDTAWASYLRGDRGIFTRRAVRLLETSEAREISEIYDNDSEFREHVNRYIHDFESMLRVMLSTRDGNAVSVTLLSSDMGKLYVVLAQAIERLRQ